MNRYLRHDRTSPICVPTASTPLTTAFGNAHTGRKQNARVAGFLWCLLSVFLFLSLAFAVFPPFFLLSFPGWRETALKGDSALFGRPPASRGWLLSSSQGFRPPAGTPVSSFFSPLNPPLFPLSVFVLTQRFSRSLLEHRYRAVASLPGGAEVNRCRRNLCQCRRCRSRGRHSPPRHRALLGRGLVYA